MITKVKYRKDGKTVKWVKYYPDKTEYVGTWPWRPCATGDAISTDIPVTITTTDGPGDSFSWTWDSEQV